jgi:hypothetical protein
MPYYQVCTYRNNFITPMDFAEIVNRVFRNYNKAAALVEINDLGEQVSYGLHNDYEYDNVLFTEHAGRGGKRITTGFSKGVDIGVRTTKTVKSVGCSILKLLVEQNQLVINDMNTITELGTFSKKANSYEAEPGNHDDMVMGLVLFGWLTDQQYFKEITDINTLMKLREKTDDDVMNDLSPFGFIFDGSDDLAEELELTGTNWLMRDESDENRFL